MPILNFKHQVSDPAFYDPLIAAQKKQACRNPNDAAGWLDLGRLREAKIDMTQYFAKRNFAIRYFIPLYLLSISGFIWLLFSLNISTPVLPYLSWRFYALIFILLACAVVFSFLCFFRYPPSGGQYFKKAIALDPQCADAYMYFGVIALRRYQKKKACRSFELAVQLNASNKDKIEQELKSIYEKEFSSFFNKKAAKEIGQQQIIDHQLDQIKKLRLQKANLAKMVANMNGKLDQARWEMGHKTKMMNKELKSHISAIQQDYEGQITVLKEEAKEEAKELAERNFVRLTTEIMESKARLEMQSLETAARTVEDRVGRQSWQAFSEQTRCYLATAEHVYTMLIEQEEKPDYSLVGMELCKALETELNRRFVEPFKVYLNGKKSEFLSINKTGQNKERPSYFSYLAKVIDQANYPEVNSLTLGQYHFTLKLTLEGDYALSEYRDFLNERCGASGTIIGKAFLENLATVTQKYRNTIAHQSPMNKMQCDHLRELIFAGKQALLKICCRIVMSGT